MCGIIAGTIDYVWHDDRKPRPVRGFRVLDLWISTAAGREIFLLGLGTFLALGGNSFGGNSSGVTEMVPVNDWFSCNRSTN